MNLYIFGVLPIFRHLPFSRHCLQVTRKPTFSKTKKFEKFYYDMISQQQSKERLMIFGKGSYIICELKK